MTKQISILALSPQEFRHDLGVLAEQGVRVLCMPFRWQERLLHSFYREAVTTPEIHMPASGSHAKKAKDAYRKFLRTFLPKFYRRLGVDAVIGANVKYKEDLDIGAVSKQVGIPYIVFHRENLAITDGVYNVVTDRYRKLGKFQGSCIAVHNNIAARSFVETEYVDAARIAQLGCLRMDNFLRRIQMPRPKRARPLVTLFSFKSFMRGIFGQEGYFPVFRDSHGPIALLAARHPEIDFLIKPKTGTLRNPRFKPELDRAFRHWDIDPKNLPANLRIDPSLDAQEVILKSSVVLALNSTTQIEAAVAGLPVIMPYFKDMRCAPAGRNVKFKEHMDLFEVPDTPEQLMERVLARIDDPTVPEEIMDKRRALFSELVSTIEGGAAERYVDLLRRVVAEDGGMRVPRHVVCKQIGEFPIALISPPSRA